MLSLRLRRAAQGDETWKVRTGLHGRSPGAKTRTDLEGALSPEVPVGAWILRRGTRSLTPKPSRPPSAGPAGRRGPCAGLSRIPGPECVLILIRTRPDPFRRFPRPQPARDVDSHGAAVRPPAQPGSREAAVPWESSQERASAGLLWQWRL
eukprot:scaffold1687_cov405-Prasinococcus_capsulatus_cf.AAC.9